MPFVYLDMIKLAIPRSVRWPHDPSASQTGRAEVSHDDDTQYVMFGTYDLLHYKLPTDSVSLGEGTRWLEQRHEDRHNLDWDYERHPVYLYDPDPSASRVKKVLDHNENQTRPLVLTMVRVAKHDLPTVQAKLKDVTDTLHRQISESGILESDTPVAVCWNLGNADFLILSRPKTLSSLRDLYYRLNAEGLHLTHGGGEESSCRIRFASFSSYCAFPKGSADGEVAQDNLHAWLNSDDELQFINFADSLASPYKVQKRFGTSRFLFGDRDYQLFSVFDEVDRAKAISTIAEEMLGTAHTPLIQSSSLIPALSIPKSPGGATVGMTTGEALAPGGGVLYGLSWPEIDCARVRIMNCIDAVIRIVEGRAGIPHNLKTQYAEHFKHCKNTLDALYKYAVRLYAAAYQDDIYYIIQGLYTSLSDILDDVNKRLCKLCEPETLDSVKELRKNLSLVYVDVMCFVSELQHIYTVLAISPHSHMETYYGSMRSLNASSKLWTSYCGVAKVLSGLFPTKNQDKDQTCSVLIVPYRERYSSSRRIVPHIYSDSILIRMQINYQMMFDARATLYIIAHELGHYIFMTTRKERSQLLFKTVLSQLISNFYDDMLECPLYTLAHAPKTRGSGVSKSGVDEYRNIVRQLEGTKSTDGMADVRTIRKALCLNVCSSVEPGKGRNLYRDMSSELRGAYEDIERELVSRYAEEFGRYYEERTHNQSELKYYYGKNIVKEIQFYINERIDSCFDKLHSLIAGANVRFLQGLGAYESGYNIRFDPQQAVRLKTYWQYSQADRPASDKTAKANPKDGQMGGGVTPVESNRDKQPHFTAVVPIQILTEQCNRVLSLFREIHAEVFACKTMGFRQQDYLDHVSNYADTVPGPLNHAANIHRIMAICESVFSDHGCTELLRWLDVDEHESDRCPFMFEERVSAALKIRYILQRRYYEYIVAYGINVSNEIDERIREIENDESQTELLRSVRRFVAGADEMAQEMWNFWLQAMV